MPDTNSTTLVLYDGICGLCNGLNQFLLKRDPNDHFRFATLQSEFSATLLKRYDVNAVHPDTVYVVADYGQPTQRLLARSDAVLHILERLGGVWGFLKLGRVLPKFLRDALYNVVARNRYRVFGKYDVCLMPEERYRRKFLDQGAPVTASVTRH